MSNLLESYRSHTMIRCLQPKCTALNLDGMLTAEERAIRLRVRTFMEKEVAPVIAGYWEKAEFPFALVPGFAKLNLAGGGIKGYGCPVSTGYGDAADGTLLDWATRQC